VHDLESAVDHLTRRDFFKYAVTLLASLSPAARLRGDERLSPERGFLRKREAMFYEKLDGRAVRCTLCPKMCWVGDGGRGYCGVRQNVGGKYYTLVSDNPCALHVDPIEKKPLFHYLPGTRALSLATAGCNIECKYCQNWSISQSVPEETYNFDLPPLSVVDLAKKEQCRSIAYTYTEPMVFYEYVLHTSEEAQRQNIRNVLVTNGFVNPPPLEELCGSVDAANVDLKGFTEQFYGDVCRGVLKDVLKSLKTYRRRSIHLEITNLIVPTLNDDMGSIREMCRWVKDELGEDVPLHFSRFTPTYKLKNLPLTPLETLERARETALEVGLHYVYIGNVPGHSAENTFCPGCGKVLVDRTGYSLREFNLQDGRCRFCGKPVPGVWE
jgi:pyruvate formate lyase activating enzyme